MGSANDCDEKAEHSHKLTSVAKEKDVDLKTIYQQLGNNLAELSATVNCREALSYYCRCIQMNMLLGALFELSVSCIL